MKLSILLTIGALSLLSVPSARALDSIIVPPSVSVAPRSVITVTWIITNTTGKVHELLVPGILEGRLHAGTSRSETLSLSAMGSAGPVKIEGGGFFKAQYKLEIPVGFMGPVILELAGTGAQPIMFSVQASDQAELASTLASTAGAQAEQGLLVRHENALRRSTRLLPGISANEPIYFGLGTHEGVNAKFQLSFKYSALDLWPVYLGYTQTSLWDLHSTSKPFRDTSYRPSLFFHKDAAWVSADKRFVWSYQGGFEHESNGKGGTDTRSINIGFVRPKFEWLLGKETRLFVSPKIYGYIEKSENPDISDYRGYADLQLGVRYQDWKLSTTVRKGTRGKFGSVQVDAVFPLRQSDAVLSKLGVHGMNGYFFLQYFNGWGETILDYRSKMPYQVRGGLMLVP